MQPWLGSRTGLRSFTVTGIGGVKKAFRALSMRLEGVMWNLGTFWYFMKTERLKF